MIGVLIASVIIANILGIALHYVHKPSTNSLIVHIFTAVNESTWEHLKLAFTPMLGISIVQYFILNSEFNNILEANLYAIIGSILFIPIFYYPIRYILKKEVLAVSISLFVVSIICGYVISYYVLINNIKLIGEPFAILILASFIALFAEFTFRPPKFFLFRDPVKNLYGHKL